MQCDASPRRYSAAMTQRRKHSREIIQSSRSWRMNEGAAASPWTDPSTKPISALPPRARFKAHCQRCPCSEVGTESWMVPLVTQCVGTSTRTCPSSPTPGKCHGLPRSDQRGRAPLSALPDASQMLPAGTWVSAKLVPWYCRLLTGF